MHRLVEVRARSYLFGRGRHYVASMSLFESKTQLLSALAGYDFSGQDEQAIREQWIYPLLMLLGYGLGTKNTVDIPFKVELRAPVRALGSKRWEIDYRPTAHGVGMWIIEAKRPDEDLFSEQHLGQAWGYATHPRVDVPLMMLANGTRLLVFDLTQDDWDQPLTDIRQTELPDRFDELEATLGARNVAEFVRARQLRHLSRALGAQLDLEALDKTIADVQRIVNEARPQVVANRAAVTSDAWDEFFKREKSWATDIGISGVAFAASGPNMVLQGDLEACAGMVRDRAPTDRAAAFEEMASVARVGTTVRQTFSLRILRLGVALRCVGLDGCDDVARETAETLAREAAEGLAADPVAAAAYEFEGVLAAFVARIVLVGQTDAAKNAIETARETFDVERFLRDSILDGLSAEAMLSQSVELMFRSAWIAFEPWTDHALRHGTEVLRQALRELPPPGDVRIGQVNNANFEFRMVDDPLRPVTRNVVRDVADAKVLSSDDAPELEVQRAFAVSLLQRYFAA